METLTGTRRLAVGAALLVALIRAGTAEAQVACGDVIGPNETVVLQGNLERCGPGPAALTVVGPATLDLNGFSVICQSAGVDTAVGIVVVGKRATLRNGTVQICQRGVHVLGEGSHRIEGVTVAVADAGSGRLGEGFRVESSGNRLIDNASLQSGDSGFLVLGASGNRLIGNLSFFNAFGFQLASTERTTLRDNVASRNTNRGFLLDRGTRNTVVDNTATDNSVGIDVTDETSAKVTGNVASSNRANGMEIFSSIRTRVVGNFAEDNQRHGIVVASGQDNVITRNTALNNDRGDNAGPRADLVDSQPECGTNRWVRNVFVTSDPAVCIR